MHCMLRRFAGRGRRGGRCRAFRRFSDCRRIEELCPHVCDPPGRIECIIRSAGLRSSGDVKISCGNNENFLYSVYL